MDGEKKYIVLWRQGGRVGSLPLTLDNLNGLQKELHLSVLQIDASGTQHYNVIGIR